MFFSKRLFSFDHVNSSLNFETLTSQESRDTGGSSTIVYAVYYVDPL